MRRFSNREFMRKKGTEAWSGLRSWISKTPGTQSRNRDGPKDTRFSQVCVLDMTSIRRWIEAPATPATRGCLGQIKFRRKGSILDHSIESYERPIFKGIRGAVDAQNRYLVKLPLVSVS